MMDRFQFEFAYLTIDVEECSFQMLNAVPGLPKQRIQLIGS